MEPSENMNAWNISVFDLLTKLLTHRVNGRTLKVNKAQDQPTGRGGGASGGGYQPRGY